MLLSLQLIQTNKLKHYPSIHGDFSSEFRQPCVVFTGHPSLRFGDVVHFMELWGKSSLNTIIFTGNYSSVINLAWMKHQHKGDVFILKPLFPSCNQSQTSPTSMPWLRTSRWQWSVFTAPLTHGSTSTKCRSCSRKSRYVANTQLNGNYITATWNDSLGFLEGYSFEKWVK